MTGRHAGRGRSAGVAVLAAVLAIAGCGGSDSGDPEPVGSPAPTGNAVPEVIDCSFNQPAVRPSKLILACADLGLRVEQIAWTSWGPGTAEGDGIQHLNTCDPNCAAGHFVTKPVRIVLTDLVEPGHVFTRATTIDANGEKLSRPLTKR
ncbi:hypothetical protein [Nocardia wallacei]|uniref:hypothetical protein n=1 Tax=Nocardia wallacei TaxID=480035 RepID=UPI002457906F|nr:hypothetical protein [Nocardia wallacei]